MKEVYAFRPVPIDYEPHLRNRFAVHLPEACDVTHDYVHDASAIKFDFKKGAWDDITFSFLEAVDLEHVFNKIMDYYVGGGLKTDPIELVLLDGPLEKGYEMAIDEYEVISLSRPDLTYAEDGLYLTKLTIRPVAITFGSESNRKTYRNRE
jgi:hypothetical protein